MVDPNIEIDRQVEFFQRYVARVERRISHLSGISGNYSWGRLAILVVGVPGSYVAFQFGGDLPGWIAIGAFVLLFSVVAHYHGRIDRSVRRHRLWLRIKRAHAARITHDWEGIPRHRDFQDDDLHPFERDLNLTGERSIHHLIDTAVSNEGSARLRAWLVNRIPDPEATLERQAIVRELAPRSSFRDRLVLKGMLIARDPTERWEGEHLIGWLDSSILPSLKPFLTLVSGLAAVNVVLAVLYYLGLLPLLWPYGLLLYIGVYLFRRKGFDTLFEDAVHLEMRLSQIRAVFLFLEEYSYHRTPRLGALCAPFRSGDRKPSRLLRSVTKIAWGASFQRNPLTQILLNVAFPWDLYFAHRLNLAKREIRAELPVWLECWYELEALCSLANFADLNPGSTFPDIMATGEEGDLFQATAIGHPLLPAASRVANDFRVGPMGEIAFITGSNMSGKSTFLRTLGVNLSLAFAGGPVCAVGLRTVPLRMYTCINVTDSVNDGISYFYAEVRRLRGLLDELRSGHPFPLFFLIDEIFRGTNNRERLIGSRSYIHALAGGHGTGLVSTHDLELIHLADQIPLIRNYHFRESISNGRMVFDFQLRHGPSPTTNALAIMRLEGLPVEE
jgi:hypothetical protein